MADRTLSGCRILVVEDEYMLADDLSMELEEAGATVIGPVGSVAGALDTIAAEPRIDGAILDVNLQGETVFPAADLLIGRHVPIVFTTGYDASSIPEAFRGIARCEKPVNLRQLVTAIGCLVDA